LVLLGPYESSSASGPLNPFFGKTPWGLGGLAQGPGEGPTGGPANLRRVAPEIPFPARRPYLAPRRRRKAARVLHAFTPPDNGPGPRPPFPRESPPPPPSLRRPSSKPRRTPLSGPFRESHIEKFTGRDGGPCQRGNPRPPGALGPARCLISRASAAAGENFSGRKRSATPTNNNSHGKLARRGRSSGAARKGP